MTMPSSFFSPLWGTWPKRSSTQPPTVSNASLGTRQPGGGVQLVDGELAGHAEDSGVDPLDEALVLVELVANLSDELLEEVLERDEPGGAAVFVYDDGEVELLGLELTEERVRALGLGHEIRRMQAGAQIEAGGQPAHVGQQVLGVEHPHDLVNGVLEHGHARMQLVAQPAEELVRRAW